MTAASTLANSLAPAAAALPQVDKIFWNGRHSIYGYSSPLGKLPRAALKNLVSLGWREVDSSDANAVPAFAWTSRKAADFPATTGPHLPPSHTTRARSHTIGKRRHSALLGWVVQRRMARHKICKAGALTVLPFEFP